MKQLGGSDLAERFEKIGVSYVASVAGRWHQMPWKERYRTWTTAPAWWGQPTKNTLDRATACFPDLLAERLEGLGIDFAVMYASTAAILPDIVDPEL